jgi:hypothetical protein
VRTPKNRRIDVDPYACSVARAELSRSILTQVDLRSALAWLRPYNYITLSSPRTLMHVRSLFRACKLADWSCFLDASHPECRGTCVWTNFQPYEAGEASGKVRSECSTRPPSKTPKATRARWYGPCSMERERTSRGDQRAPSHPRLSFLSSLSSRVRVLAFGRRLALAPAPSDSQPRKGWRRAAIALARPRGHSRGDRRRRTHGYEERRRDTHRLAGEREAPPPLSALAPRLLWCCALVPPPCARRSQGERTTPERAAAEGTAERDRRQTGRSAP